MKSKFIPMLVLASGISLATAACSKHDDNGEAGNAAATGAATPAPAVTASHATDFLTDVIQDNNAEIKFGQAAQAMGSTQAVRDFGKMLVDDHTKANGQASQLATAMNVAVPSGIKPDAMSAYNTVTGMTGAGFDKDFVATMIKDHQKAIDAFQQEAGSSDPAQVTDFAKQTLPTLKKHLQMAQSLQK
ncbi:MAG: DUF4142 domain-containing protein [Croceibacterium sp.]